MKRWVSVIMLILFSVILVLGCAPRTPPTTPPTDTEDTAPPPLPEDETPPEVPTPEQVTP